MLDDAFSVLDLPPDCDDETIRRRYLELIRTYTPEQHPERFAAIRSAYERLRNAETRLSRWLFDPGRTDVLDAILEEVACRSPRRRPTLSNLLPPV